MKSVFVISAQPLFAERICKFLTESNYFCEIAPTLEDGLIQMGQQQYDIVFCELPILTHTDASIILSQLKEKNPDTHIVFIAEKIGLKKAISLVKEGVYTCVNRPIHREELLAIIEEIKTNENKEFATNSTTKNLPLKKEAKSAIHQSATPNYVKGISSFSRELYKQIDLVRDTSLHIIVYGETGTGKESVARRLAGKNGKFPGPFVAIDCGCLSKELAASELFGHEKGAFTGAFSDRKGAFEIAKNGTIFLDEIGNLDYQVQTYLLRAIQERKIRRVGGAKEIEINVRIIVACNELLADLVQNGEFREDLYHRLNEFEINIPTLRDRREDIPFFVAFFLEKSAEEFSKKLQTFTPEAMKALQDYHWPGNIRELKNTIRKICLMAADTATEIDVNDILSFLPAQEIAMELKLENAVSVKSNYETMAASKPIQNLKEQVTNTELEAIMKVLKSVNYNKTKAAEILQINRKTLYNKLKLIEKLSADS